VQLIPGKRSLHPEFPATLLQITSCDDGEGLMPRKALAFMTCVCGIRCVWY
jgi:hypothetical protein